MASGLWCSILILTLLEVAFRVHGEPPGFISIDCGIPSGSHYNDEFTGLPFVSDDQYIDTGINYNTSSYSKDFKYLMFKQLETVRSFPNLTKNCYTLAPVIKGNKYLIRAIFWYADYDNSDKPPTFDMYLGVNFWRTVNLTLDPFPNLEIITIASADYMQVCLVNTGSGTPFISSLELRPLAADLYGVVNSSQSLDLYFVRSNMGSADLLVRYPKDPYDRQWYNFTYEFWTNISTNFQVSPDKSFDTPSMVLQTAVIPTKSAHYSFDINWNSSNISTVFYVVTHITEIESLAAGDIREFNLYGNELKMFGPILPSYLSSYSYSYTQSGATSYSISLQSTARSTLPPIVNALEIYSVIPIMLLPTETQDVIAINAIKGNYSLYKEWSGDPCVPVSLSWTGVSCTLTSSKIPQITGLNLTSLGMTGGIISAFGDLTSLKSLDLSSNNLSGSIPRSLDRLTSLTFLDLSGNENLSTTLPPGLQKRKDKRLLMTKGVSDNCESGGCGKKKTLIIIIVIVVIVILLVIGVVATVLLCKKKGRYNEITISAEPNGHVGTTPLRNGHPGNYAYSPNNVNAPANNYGNNSNGTHDKEENMLHLESRQFTFNELKMITNNFQNNIGTGGFGSVFVGSLEKGKQVAVKLRSEKSSQGFKEFLAEAQNLSRVHHKNLVSLVGYCMEGEYMALVYEYMPEGTLQDKLRDNFSPLSWKQRLKIGYESAQGLEYLHKSCNPPLVHRDVKTNNILLTANLEAKIADFGLVRAFDGDGTNSHVSTRIVGTPGYLDPDYYTTSQLSEKSDVYSFGVVLLEIVTGQAPIIEGPDGGHLTKLVRQKLSKGNIESIIDPRMGGQYDVNSVWKVAELGLKCTDQALKRPTMIGVVAELKESLDLENSSGGMRSVVSGSTGQYNNSRNENWISDVSNGSGFEMGYMGNVPDTHGPTAR